MTLEEQLRAVQKQLQALSQLPSSVQMTLDAVSKQLADIVGTNEDNEDDQEKKDEETDKEINADLEKMEEGKDFS